MNIESVIHEALANYMRGGLDLDVAEVVSFEDDTASGGYCETCYYEYAVVKVHYQNSKNRSCIYTYDGDFAELIWALDRYSEGVTK